MLEVKLLISDLDYDGVVDLVVPAVAKKLRTRKGLVGRLAWKQEELLRMAHKFLNQKDQDERDRFVADMAAKKRSLIVEKVSALVEKKGVNVQICDISVKKI